MSDPRERLAAALADRYRIERQLGEGGMATVYLAEDLKHQRQVAIKVLKPELAAVLGAERFVQEITTTAQLQHPHILPLFDSGTADGFLFYVMPYVEGETLRDKLNRETQLGVEEAVRITREVADALDYAHRHGVIHRDIKPENILLHDGRPMVADFGIALAVSAAAGGRMTETGMSLGTPYYMSPEQATADKDITGRSDVYSLATVLYEMLTGDPPHVGSSAQQIIVKIIADEARPVREVRKSVPPNVAAAVGKALEKLPADRFESAKAFGDALADPGFRLVSVGGTVSDAGGRARWKERVAVPLSALSVLLILAVVLLLVRRPLPPQGRSWEFTVRDGEGQVVQGAVPAPSPDGSYLLIPRAERLGGGILLKRASELRAVLVPGTEGVVASPEISPDGSAIAFLADGELRTLALSGGSLTTVATDAITRPVQEGVAWLDDGSLVYMSRDGLSRVVPGEGPPQIVVRADSLSAAAPRPLPGARGVVFERCHTGCATWVYDLRSGAARELLRGRLAQFVRPGYLVYLGGDDESQVTAVPFDLRRLALRGAAVALGMTAMGMRVSMDGSLVARERSVSRGEGSGRLVWIDSAGGETPVDTTVRVNATISAGSSGWSLSPDGRRLAIALATDAGENIWVKDLPDGRLRRLTFGPGPEVRPRWSADGEWITFVATNGATQGVYARRADGSGSDSLLYATTTDVSEAVLQPGGPWLLIREGLVNPGPGGRDIRGIRPGLDSATVPLVATRYDESSIAPSPDGRLLAYVSDEGGPYQVFLQPFPALDGGKWQVSNSGGTNVVWSRDGRELFYLTPQDTMMAVSVTYAGGAVTLGAPRPLFGLRDGFLGAGSSYYPVWDVAPDGRFLMVSDPGRTREGSRLVVVENLQQELKAKVPR
jgi:Tol biopolymer transport system component